MAGLTDVLSVVQNGVVAFNNFSKQMAGSLLNISGQLTTDATNIAALQALVPLTKITAATSADIVMNNTATYFDGPIVAQGSSGVWLATGTVTFTDSTGSTNIACKLWDGTTVMASGNTFLPTAGSFLTQSLSGVITSPSSNIRISCRDVNQTTGKIVFNQSGNSKDSTITVIRIG
jgi:hypothetical protein